VIAVTREGPKDVSSTEGMAHTVRTSPYYPAWVERAPQLFARVKDAVLRRDLPALGAAAEESALAMHACALAASPAVRYWTPATVAALDAVHHLRAAGVGAWFTIDAGPHVKVITEAGDEARVVAALAAASGVLRTIACRPGAGARLADRAAEEP
jgi:diphosphomevalonate decarboxylase